MYELLHTIDGWFSEGQNVALATVIRTWNSAPRATGSHMAITSAMEFSGSVSGGCVEAQVIQTALECIQRQTARRLTFGVSNDEALEAGLACGGKIEVLVQPLKPKVFRKVRHALLDGLTITYRTRVSTGEFDPLLEIVPATELAPKVLRTSEGEFFYNPVHPAPHIFAIGGSHITQVLSRLVAAVGYELTVVEPRKAFAVPSRFEDGTRVLTSWPQDVLHHKTLTNNRSVIALSHDPKIDDPALSIALESEAFYIGALGSRKTHIDRMTRLETMGHSLDAIKRIDSPAGLQIGAANPEEIAVAILGKVVAMRNASLQKLMEHLVAQ